jgi:hypothetical protein
VDKYTQNLPSRSWLNKVLERYSLTLAYSKEMDPTKIFEATHQKIKNFFDIFGNFIASFPPELIFNADESMIDLHQYTKVVYRNNALNNSEKKTILEVLEHHIPHISGMFCFSAAGAIVKPMIILPYQNTLTPDIIEIIARNQCWLVSGNSGWETKDTFFLWTVCFCIWANQFRSELPNPQLRTHPILLLLDGHSSRKDLPSLQLYKAFNIIILIFPSNVTHLLQPFDIGIGAVFKKNLKMLFTQLNAVDRTGFDNDSAFYRYVCIESLIRAWNSSASPELCKTSFRISGIFPTDVEKVFTGCYVTNEEYLPNNLILRPKKIRNLFRINSRILTDENFIDYLRTNLKQKNLGNVVDFIENEDFLNQCTALIRAKTKEINVFTQFPQFIYREGDPIQIQCPYGCHSIDCYMKNLEIPIYPIDNYIHCLHPSKISTILSLSDYLTIITEIKKGANFDMLKVLSLDHTHVYCLKNLKIQTCNTNQSIILNNAGKICHLQSHYSEEFIKVLYIDISKEFYFLTTYCPYSLKAISQKQYCISPQIANCILYQILLCFQTIIARDYLPFPIQLKHLLLNSQSRITLTNLENLIPIKQISNLKVFECGKIDVLETIPPEILFKDAVKPEKTAIWIAGILIIEFLLDRQILEPVLYTYFGICEQMFNIFDGPSDFLAKKWIIFTSSLSIKIQSTKQSRINEILLKDLSPQFHYLIDTIEQMTLLDQEKRPTIKQLLKSEIMKNAQKQISHFELHFPECPHFETNKSSHLYGTFEIKNQNSTDVTTNED